MFLLKKLLSSWLLPPFGFLVLAIVVLLFGRRYRWGLLTSGVGIILTLLMSLPIVANQLSLPLEPRPISSVALNKAQAIVILGCGVYRGAAEYGGDTVSKHALERLRYGAKLARESHLPVLVSGGSVYGGQAEGLLMKQVLENEFLVPVRWVESQSRDTAQNAAFSSSVLKEAGISRIALVTHAWHMPRATRSFAQYGLNVAPAPTGFTPQSMSLLESLLPSTAAFERSTNAIHEWAGRLLLS